MMAAFPHGFINRRRYGRFLFDQADVRLIQRIQQRLGFSSDRSVFLGFSAISRCSAAFDRCTHCISVRLPDQRNKYP
jgi:hypothetical protein